jgi:hypothetical protein
MAAAHAQTVAAMWELAAHFAAEQRADPEAAQAIAAINRLVHIVQVQ